MRNFVLGFVMAQMVIYIRLEKYLAEWLTHSLGDPVRFPASSNENAVIRAFIRKPGEDDKPQLGGPGYTAIVIPESKAKPPDQYHYIGEKGQKAVREAIMDLFTRSLWTDLSRLEDSHIGVNTRIAAWCELHGIDLDRVETVRQKYYRIRDAYYRKGINLKNFDKQKKDNEG